MKKNISINIQGLIFYIEEDCYEPLRAYLGDIHRYFAKYEDSREIIEDIEGRIAEIFCEKLSKQKQVITQADVEDLIAQMGSIDDFQNAEEDPAFQSTFEKGKDLELPTENDFESGTNRGLPRKTQAVRVGQSEAYEEVMVPHRHRAGFSRARFLPRRNLRKGKTPLPRYPAQGGGRGGRRNGSFHWH
ncbi:MAG: hypothetical protein HC913_12315 [Microscillaceae bacterium]|nr:hypothetical protein [Microscillaceae bacterium]